MTTHITYGQLQDGDRVWIQGYLFEVRNLRIAARKGERMTMHGEPNRDDVIRFNGHLVDPSVDIAATSYNGGVYGGYAFRPAIVERQ